MPSPSTKAAREERKAKVLDVIDGSMTARDIAARLGWPVAITRSILTALVAENRLRKVDSIVTYYNHRKGSSKEVGVYAPPMCTSSLMPAWLTG
jgi:hypothetical protein